MKKILVIGSIGYDLTTYFEKMPVIGETIVGKKFAQNPGAKGNNQAVASSRMGAHSTFIGAVGDDIYGDILKKNLDDNNVKHNLKVVPNMSCQIATILVEPNGQNRIIIVPGANSCVDKKQIDDNEKLIEESDIIILQLEIPLETVEYAIDVAYKKNKIIILNPAPGAKLSENILKKVNYLTPNENELSVVSGMPTDTMEQIELASKKLVDLGVKNLIVTLGEKGCLLYNKEVKKIYGAYPTNPVDTAGAGDCFTGVFATFLSKDYEISEAIKYANLASSISVSRIGTVPSFPTLEEIEEAKKKIKNW
jgi:ribokinase